MKNNNLAIAFSILSLIGIAFSAAYASSIHAECNTCITDSPCSGIRAWGNDGAPIGCEEKVIGTDCKGNCYKCKNGGSGSFCRWTGKASDTCISDTGAWTDCGDTYKLNCTGGPFPDCNCTGTEQYQDNDCKLHFCS